MTDGGRLKDRVVLVTGATRGLGRRIAELTANEGANVVVTGRTESAGTEVVDGIRESSGRAMFVRCDVTSEADIQAAIQTTVETWGHLDGLVANAADTTLAHLDGPVTELDLESWNKIILSDLTSVYLTAKHGIRAMCQGNGGSVVLMTSQCALEGVNGVDAYTAAKGGIVSLTRSIASFYSRYNVRCNAIAPGMIDVGGGAHRLDNDEFRVHMTRRSLGILGEPNDVAYLVVYLLSDESRYTDGVIVPVDGGALSASHIVRPHEREMPHYVRKRPNAP